MEKKLQDVIAGCNCRTEPGVPSFGIQGHLDAQWSASPHF